MPLFPLNHHLDHFSEGAYKLPSPFFSPYSTNSTLLSYKTPTVTPIAPMPQITQDPTGHTCPDFASLTYAAVRLAMMTGGHLNDAAAAEQLVTAWNQIHTGGQGLGPTSPS